MDEERADTVRPGAGSGAAHKEASCMEECLDYFRKRPVYGKVFAKIREKTVGLGHFGGKVIFTSLTQQEKEELEGFFQKSFRNQKTVTISAALMQKALDTSRFSSLHWEAILEAYFGEPLVGKQELMRRKSEEQTLFFRQFLDGEEAETDGKDTQSPGQLWLRRVLEEGGAGAGLLLTQYRENREQLRTALRMVMRASEQLPVFRRTLETLPVFAARITGNPHDFDADRVSGRLLETFLADYGGCQREPEYSESEWKSRILYQAGLLRDELSNDTMVYGIQAERRDGTLHEGICGFYRMKEPVVCTLRTLGGLERAWGAPNVYVVENPAVFSELMHRYPQSSLVCTNGQPRLASLVLLDLLKTSGTLWYAGDFDPEGLLIAQNLKRRYGDALKFWDYQPSYYQKAVSEVELGDKRLRMLEHVTEPELLPIAELMRCSRRAAYQEAMLEWAYRIG